MKTYDFYILGWDDGKPTLEFVKSTTHKWPVTAFKALAEEMGFSVLKRDVSLVGGYFVDPPTGDCLICYPHGLDPAQAYL